MKTLAELAQVLESARKRQKLSYKALAARVGLTPLAVRQALSGKSALRAHNLMALADELGLELMLLPKGVARSFQPGGAAADSAGLDMGSASPAYVSQLDRLLKTLATDSPAPEATPSLPPTDSPEKDR
ncbi:hypothetical protein J2W49_004640 [Hydrogenophaga palleronii]|uniref:HTH cro/C1-type domain-containing protein n=1 Tax=Hydrogenophaga palleronii TaxID=65655 RepID=A0ABU1WUJ2_9BURK|nr:helix-turn-helix transcriptional regulator [Hydrogenophaga palleronii]MDR7152662.1 hypothetical protein [Hydrogenophaga palleronii]